MEIKLMQVCLKTEMCCRVYGLELEFSFSTWRKGESRARMAAKSESGSVERDPLQIYMDHTKRAENLHKLVFLSLSLPF